MFGPDEGSYILSTPQKASHRNIPPAMARQLADANTLRTAILDEQGRWLMYFQTPDGDHTYRSSTSFNAHYDPGPYSWLAARLAAHSSPWPRLSASLGAHDSVLLALAGGACSYTPALPRATERALQRVRAPVLVAQGVGGAYVMMHGRRGRAVAWDLCGGYAVLGDVLEKIAGRYEVSFVALNAWKDDEFFLMLEDKVCFYHVAPRIHAAVGAALGDVGIPANVVRRDGTQGLRAAGVCGTLTTTAPGDGDGVSTVTATTTTVSIAALGPERDELCAAIETAIMGYNFMNLAGGVAPVTAAAGCAAM
ncbi:hypothetical protein BROUX41_006759 [Berkeleyomyces rouxiae]|uniref:uncharacterized protein n=1 Tax=Berkeleyomyces rouxiae TaxID=2035830 RepID=UPI003B7D04C4